MGFSRQEYWNGLPFPSPGDLPNQGINRGSPTLQAGSLLSEPLGNANPTPHPLAKKKKKGITETKVKELFPHIFFWAFMISGLIVSLIHFELGFVSGVR